MLNKTEIHTTASIAEGAVFSDDLHLGAFSVIEAGANIGRSVVIGSGAIISSNSTIDDCVAIASGVIFSADGVKVGEGAKIGANAVIGRVHIGIGSEVMPATIVTKNVPPYAIVSGNPAQIIGYTATAEISAKPMSLANEDSLTGAKRLAIPKFSDLRGDLNVLEFNDQLPFAIKRLFYTYNIATSEIRGEHAHKECEQLLISVAGSLNVIVDDGGNREEYILDSPDTGLYIPAGCWAVMYKHTPDSVLLVLASLPYDEADYIRDYEEFLNYKK